MKNISSNIGPRDYKITDIKRLFTESYNQCAAPNCKNKLIAEDNITIIGKICHIEAANEKGPRYNSDMNDDQRRSYDNLILLCDEHHRIIDNPTNENKYEEKLLKDWKHKHITVNEKIDSEISLDLLQEFIEFSKSYYSKIDSLDGPYTPTFAKHYIPRSIESELIKVLKNEQILLLTGISFCGKSQTAFHIASEFYNDGFLYKRVLNTRDAVSFLESSGKKRICVLEDPFGHSFGSENRDELKLIRDLLETLPSENLLIITSKKEIVFSTFNQSNLKNCDIRNHKWHDLTIKDKEFLLKLWSKLTIENSILEDNKEIVTSIIQEGYELQPGQLYYLSKQQELNSGILQKEKIYSIAQVDIDDICNSILDRTDSTWKVYALLGLAANTKFGLSLEDFDYLLEKKEQSLSLEKKVSSIKSYSLQDSSKFKLPNYNSDCNNSSNLEPQLDYLEKSGYIEYSNQQYIFRHPHYQEIGKNLLKKLSRLKQRELIPHIKNILTCLNSEAAFNCANNLNLLFDTYTGYQKDIIEIASDISERSIFPKVADSCALFLMSVYDDPLAEAYRSNIVYRLQSKSEEYGVSFYNEKPYRVSNVDFFDKLNFWSEESYQESLIKFKENNSLSMQKIWGSLLTINSFDITPDIDFLEYCFKSNEVFIRNLSAYIFFYNLSEFNNSHLRDKILTDEHPSVIFFALKGFFQGLHKNGLTANKELTERFLYFFRSDKIFCIRTSTLMTNFNTDYANESIDWRSIPEAKHKWLWRIWAKFFIQFLKTFPVDVSYFNKPRFSSTMNKAKDMVYAEQGQMISSQMLKRLVEISKTRLLNHFEMHLIDFFVISTKEKPELRSSIFEKFFNEKLPTYFVGYNLVWTFGVWDVLTQDEKKVIYNIFSKERKDKDWLKAIVLNNQIIPPSDIIESVFGKRDFFQQSHQKIVSILDKTLLDKILQVFFGEDSAFQEIGVSGSSQDVKELVFYIAENNLPYNYDKCVSFFLSDFINGGSGNNIPFYARKWYEIYTKFPDKKHILKTVVRALGRSSFCISEAKEVLKVIIDDYCDRKQEGILAEFILENFQFLNFTSSDRDIYRILDYRDFLKESLLPVLKEQLIVLNLLSKIKTNEVEKEEYGEVLEYIIKVGNAEGLKLRSFFPLIREIKEEGTLSNKPIKDLEEFLESEKQKQETYFYRNDSKDKLEGFKYHFK